ncbi:MAG: IgGFc-binding protein, partial [Deltaproteobacteria bacterium]|nr:IgGFc-binding protein [Deltaproteobacteria bacterium]
MLLALAAAFTLGCEGADGPTYGDDDGSDSDADTDTDVDSDADSDSDTDTETDTEYTGPVIPPTCDDAADAKTSVGCDFFTLDIDNWTAADPETFAIVVSNPHEDQNADITLTHGNDSNVIYGVTLAPYELHTINVACTSGCLVAPQQIEEQGIATGVGFHLTADVPILAYQWNPYGIELYSTDASLLIPTTSLDGTYIAAAWNTGPGASWSYLNSQISVVITEDNTKISFISSTNVPEQGGVGPFTQGVESGEYTLNAYDVISMRPVALDDDLTGTAILADKPVVVFGGHSCANVPNGSYAACDHVEEQILPLAAWGTSTVLARHAVRSGCTEEQDQVVWRLIAGADDMTVYFDPPAPSPAGAEYYFAQQGELLEFWGTDDHLVEGLFNNPDDPEEPEAPFFAYQMMMGCTFASCGASEGDPMMLQSPPAGQFLDRYVFSTDEVFDFDYDHIIIVRLAGTEVELDCAGVLGPEIFESVGSSDWEVGRFFIDNPENSTGCLDGAHV